MMKRVVIFALSIVALVGLCSCGKPGTGESSSIPGVITPESTSMTAASNKDNTVTHASAGETQVTSVDAVISGSTAASSLYSNQESTTATVSSKTSEKTSVSSSAQAADSRPTTTTTATTARQKKTTAKITKPKTTTAKPSKPSTTTQTTQPTAGLSMELSADASFASLYTGERLAEGCTLTGKGDSVVLSLPSEIHLQGDLTLRSVTLKGRNTVIYANGYKLLVDSSVKSTSRDDRMTVYGGAKTAAVDSTDICLLGGNYFMVYGGGNMQPVTGDTHVVFGGNANPWDSTDDGASNYSPTTVYGGGKSATVGGTTHVTLDGNAVARYVVGAGSGATGAKIASSTILIRGGKAMNVFGGSQDAAVTVSEINITMSGGLVEGLFGGCQGRSVTGNVNVTLLGGDISRRVYSGCYNNCDVGLFSDTWTTSARVIGRTVLTVGPQVKLCTATELSSGNMDDMGVFCGSRHEKDFTEEENVLVFADGCYTAMKDTIGPSPLSTWDLCVSRHDRLVKQ